ncbi:sulfurtransferase TusA family protein [Amaricoccus solimangrovi]|uniref:Sulfurtransferase TusA family protein n=1 Tax=Amaricoccus solimangrovi TaxID=2589815 RepID=A0A501WD66_9RHOB|nr:sulfurtransferase TusA family protein [Amaricoccus solimangrovi]TPE47328.1 sulfurtransferase TusA family protein [Amaricoccus solimangrovi]
MNGESEERWDAGELGCGELVVLLRMRLRRMPGRILHLIARDTGAAEDLPAWCRMTANTLERHDPATASFWIRSKSDWN